MKCNCVANNYSMIIAGHSAIIVSIVMDHKLWCRKYGGDNLSYNSLTALYKVTGHNKNVYIIGLRDKMCHCGRVCHIYVNAYIIYIM